MLSDFNAQKIKKAKSMLDKELQIATHLQQVQKERQKELAKETSLWTKLKRLFR